MICGIFGGQAFGVFEALIRQWITNGDCLSFHISFYIPLIKQETIRPKHYASDFISNFLKS